MTIGLLKIESLGNLCCFRIPLSEVDASYTWKKIRKLVQDCVFPQCDKFGTWSSNGVRADQVLNRKVSIQKEETSVLGPQRARKRGSSPEQESTNSEPDNNFSALSSKRVKRVDRALNRKAHTPRKLDKLNSFSSNPALPSGISSQCVFLLIPVLTNSCNFPFGTYVKPFRRRVQ